LDDPNTPSFWTVSCEDGERHLGLRVGNVETNSGGRQVFELMLLDRGVEVDHTTIFRWIQAYAAELEKRIRPHLRMSNGSWRVDETYVKVKG
jgi:hypothetical protein